MCIFIFLTAIYAILINPMEIITYLMNQKSFLTLLLTCILAGSGYSQDEFKDTEIEALLSKMTLKEKIGQMNQYTGFFDPTGPEPDGKNEKLKYDHIKSGLVGSMLNVQGVKEVRAMQALAVENSRLGIPLIFGLDVIHGYQTTMPIPLAEAASWDLPLIEKSARIAAIEAAARGLNWTFAPMVDISRDARWGRVMEGAGEDPHLGSQVAAARVRGFQGKDLGDEFTIAACAKHFAGYGFSEAGRDYNTVDVGTTTLYNAILPPFKSALSAGVATFMNSFNDLNGVPATADRWLQRDILKGDWGFEGFVVSDWGSITEMIPHGFAADGRDASLRAALAGCDMDMESHLYIKHLEHLVASGDIKEATIDDGVRRILQIKYELGLFEDPYKYCDEQREASFVGHEDHHDFALEMAKNSIVLLKNEDNLLPLPQSGKKIAIIGQLASSKNSPLGNWRAAAIENSAVSVVEGMSKYDQNEYQYAVGSQFFQGMEHFVFELEIVNDTTVIAEAEALAAVSDIVVLVLGEHGFQSGEGRSRASIELPGSQQTLMERILKKNPNTVLVLMNGRPLSIPWAAENVPAILEAWHLGVQSGNAIAQVLFGDHNPSGKLPMTFPRHEGQIPIYYNHKNTGRPGPIKEVFWSHYTDLTNAPLYTFGHGLSYTTFKYSDLQIESKDQEISVSVTVENTGELDGDEVVQVYIRDMVSSITRPVKELKAFKKVALKRGERKQLHFMLSEKQLGFFGPMGEWIVEPGTFQIMVGNLSATVDMK